MSEEETFQPTTPYPGRELLFIPELNAHVKPPLESDREILMRLDHNMALLLEAVQSMVGIVEGFSSHPMAGALLKLMKR